MMDRSLLRQLMVNAFNEAELRDLCFDLSIDFETLPGGGKLEKIRELIEFCGRSGILDDLLESCRAARPYLDWEVGAANDEPGSEREQIKKAIKALEMQRGVLDDVVIDRALQPLHQQLAGLDSPPLPLQRKQVTVLYARQSGFTLMFQTDDLETLRDLIAQAWDRLQSAISKFGGRINSRSGEHLTALFGAVHSRANDPVQAVKAALEMQANLVEMQKEQEIPLSIRIGICTGSVLLEQTAVGGEFTIIGDAVKIASILEENAPANGILIADSTYDQVRGTFDVASFGPVPFKGRVEPLICYVVRKEKATPFNVERHGVVGVTTGMIGRDQEMRRLQDAYFAAAEERERHMVTITGGDGLGKTRLMDEFFDWLELRPERIRVLKNEANMANEGTHYAVLRGLLAQRVPGLEEGDDDQMRNRLVDYMRDIYFNDESAEMKAHFIGQLLGFDFSDSPYVAEVAADPQQLQNRSTLYFIEYIAMMASIHPVVLLLEDLHWADDSSLDILKRLALGLAGKSVLIVLTVRPSFWKRRPYWGEGYAWHTLVDLQPLSRRHSRHLLQEILHKIPDIPDFFAEKILDAAEGNPYYLVELIKMLWRNGIIFEEGEKWSISAIQLPRLQVPATLVGVLQAQLDGLAAEERETFQRAAIIGSTFWNITIAYLADGGSPKQLQITDEMLGRLHAREMISRREMSRFPGADEYAFRSGMLRKVALDSIPKRPRRVYHALAAKWFADIQGQRADEFAGEIADHLEQAGQTAKASQWMQRAGDLAADRFAHTEAISYFSRALGLLADEETDNRLDLLLKREKEYHLQGDRKRQAADLQELDGLAAEKGDISLQVEVALRHIRLARAVSDYPTATEWANQGLALAKEENVTELIGAAYLALGETLIWQGEYSQAHQYLQEALAHSRKFNQLKLEGDSFRHLGIIAYHQGEYALARENYEKGMQIYRQIEDWQGEAKSLNNLGIVFGREGDFTQARSYYERTIAIYRQVGDLQGESIAMLNLGTVAYQDGDYAEARIYYEQSLNIAGQIGYRRGEGFILNNLGLIDCAEGNYAWARANFVQSLAIAWEIGDREGEGQALGNLGVVAHCEGDFNAARDYCRHALSIQREIGDRDGQGYSLTTLGDALTDMQEFEDAQEVYKEALEHRRNLGQNGLAIDTMAGIARLHLANDDEERARQEAQKIVTWLTAQGSEGLGNPLHAQFTCYQVLKRVGQDRPQQMAEAKSILNQAYSDLMKRSKLYPDGEKQQKYLQNVKVHREIISAWKMEKMA